MNNNVDNAWAQLKIFQNEHKPKKNSASSRSSTSNIRDPLNNMFEMKDAWNNHHDIPQLTEDYKVGKFVKDVYYSMFPEKEGDVYPASWIFPAIDNYRQIRKERAKMLKTKVKDAMKGLKMHVVVGCILRCQLIYANVNIPVPVLIHYMNYALLRSQEKKQKVPITLELFETYRTDAKKGIKTLLKKILPSCYDELKPESLVEFTGFSILRLHRSDVFRAKRIAKYAWNNGEGDFPDSTSPSTIAIAALFTVCVLISQKVDINSFGLSKVKLSKAYNIIVESENPNVQRELTSNVKSKHSSLKLNN